MRDETMFSDTGFWIEDHTSVGGDSFQRIFDTVHSQGNIAILNGPTSSGFNLTLKLFS